MNLQTCFPVEPQCLSQSNPQIIYTEYYKKKIMRHIYWKMRNHRLAGFTYKLNLSNFAIIN